MGNNGMNELHLYLKYLSCRKRGRIWEEQMTDLSAPPYKKREREDPKNWVNYNYGLRLSDLCVPDGKILPTDEFAICDLC
jgi:hypothetical protein